MKTELRYRTFDEVLDSVKIDLPGQTLEQAISTQQLLKIVIKLNKQLGLKINPSRLTLLELDKGRVRLPDDFDVANYAMLCQGGRSGWDNQHTDPRTFEQGIARGLVLAQEAVEGTLVSTDVESSFLKEIILDLEYGENIVTHDLGTTELLVQVLSADGFEVQIDQQTLSADQLALYSEATQTLRQVKVLLYATQLTSDKATPCREVCQVLTTQQKVLLRYQSSWGQRQEFHHLEPLRFVRTKHVSADCHSFYQQARHDCTLQGGFLVAGFPTGQVLLSYQSVLENEDGELLTLDHPLVNDYYEYALKLRIFENLLLAGEDVAQKINYLQGQHKTAKLEALSFINTPDFAEFRRIWELNRRAQVHKYYLPFR